MKDQIIFFHDFLVISEWWDVYWERRHYCGIVYPVHKFYNRLLVVDFANLYESAINDTVEKWKASAKCLLQNM